MAINRTNITVQQLAQSICSMVTADRLGIISKDLLKPYKLATGGPIYDHSKNSTYCKLIGSYSSIAENTAKYISRYNKEMRIVRSTLYQCPHLKPFLLTPLIL